jgi:hypothetical protein
LSDGHLEIRSEQVHHDPDCNTPANGPPFEMIALKV